MSDDIMTPRWPRDELDLKDAAHWERMDVSDFGSAPDRILMLRRMAEHEFRLIYPARPAPSMGHTKWLVLVLRNGDQLEGYAIPSHGGFGTLIGPHVDDFDLMGLWGTINHYCVHKWGCEPLPYDMEELRDLKVLHMARRRAH